MLLDNTTLGSAGRVRPGSTQLAIALFSTAALLLLFVFRHVLATTVDVWFSSPEYSYGPIVPVIAALMLTRDIQRNASDSRGSGWWGIGSVAVGLVLWLLGSVSNTQFSGQLGLYFSVIGMLVVYFGERRCLAAWPGLVFLLFAIPLADTIQFDVTWRLQLLSSQGGVALLRILGIPVFREGNIIDLGEMQLQVAEACSGLRYLFPLAMFGFIAANCFVGTRAARVVVFVSALPITVAMNIVRISLTGLLVTQYGIEAAQGFYHEFEGWAVFCLCLVLLLLELKMICLMDGRGASVIGRLDLSPPKMPRFGIPNRRIPVGVVGTLVALCLAALISERTVNLRSPLTLSRGSFSAFNNQIGDWRGRDVSIDSDSLQRLAATDYLSRDYSNSTGSSVNVWVAYYESQKKGTAIHSPQVCIPGGGWEIEQIKTLHGFDHGAGRLSPSAITRLIIRRGTDRQLVYYWIEEAGQAVTNEYWARFLGVYNGLVKNRTDGALIRFVTPLDGRPGTEALADERLMGVARSMAPMLQGYLP